MTKDEFELALQEVEEKLGIEVAHAMDDWLKQGRDLADLMMPNGQRYGQCSAKDLERYGRAITRALEAKERLKYGEATILHRASVALH
jgi:hypothetical protein